MLVPQALAQCQHRTVFAEQNGLLLYCEVDEHLVVGIGATYGARGCGWQQGGVLVKGVQYRCGGYVAGVQAALDGWIGEHALQLDAHGGTGQPVQFALVQRLLPSVGAWVVEQPHVQYPIGVEYHARWAVEGEGVWQEGGCAHCGVVEGWMAVLASPLLVAWPGLGVRAEPASKSKRNRRHSMGPFHMGTRRDSLKRILLGSLRSGVSSQALQPA